jgi:hypothetical protein
MRDARNSGFGFLEVSTSQTYSAARANMRTELAHTNRLAAAAKSVGANFFVYLGTTMQFTDYYQTYLPSGTPMRTIHDDFVAGLENVSGVAWLDIDTFEKRMQRLFLTDIHWNANGAYQGYTEMVRMMAQIIPEIGEPRPLLRIQEFPNVQFRGLGASRSRVSTFHDVFAIPIIDLPDRHPTYRIRNRIAEYERGQFNRDTYAGHYNDIYMTRQNEMPPKIVFPGVETGRRLLLLGDSFSYWVLEPLAAHFDETFVHFTHHGNNLDFERFIEQNGITDVLFMQYGPRTLIRGATTRVYLEQVRTR